MVTRSNGCRSDDVTSHEDASPPSAKSSGRIAIVRPDGEERRTFASPVIPGARTRIRTHDCSTSESYRTALPVTSCAPVGLTAPTRTFLPPSTCRNASYFVALRSYRSATRACDTPHPSEATTAAAATAAATHVRTGRRDDEAGTTSDHSSATVPSTRSRSSSGGWISWAARANVSMPSAIADSSRRHEPHERRCDRTASSVTSSSVPSRCSASCSRTSSHVTVLLQRLAKLEQGRADPRLRGADRDALELRDLGARLAAEVRELEGRALPV